MIDAPPREGTRTATSPAVLALAAAPVLLVLWRYHGTPQGFADLFGRGAGGGEHELLAHLWPFASLFLLAFLLPLVAVLARRRPLSSVGIARPADRRTARTLLLLSPLVAIPLAWIGSTVPEVRDAYPAWRGLAARPDLVLAYEAAYVLLFYLAWEFCFRGWLLFPLEEAYGAVPAILVTTLASCLLHIGKPEGEILLSIPGGILLGWIAVRTRSFLLAWVPHAIFGVATDLLILARG